MKFNSTLYLFSALFLLISCFPINAEEEVDTPQFEAVPEPPDLPDPVESGEVLEPEVTIIQRDDAVIEEYRVNGKLYKVKVTPSVGPVYYLVDRNGDGQMERMSDIYNDYSVPQWTLFEW